MNKHAKHHLMISAIMVVVAAVLMISFVVGVNKSPTGMAIDNLEECDDFKEGMCSVCANVNNGVCSQNKLSYLYRDAGCGEWPGC